MGAEAYWYTVPYNPDVSAALQALREREFRAGRYNPAMPLISFPVGPGSPAPGAQHDSIEEAFEEADADGTRSILDLERVGDEPDFGVAVRVEDAVLEELFGTMRPTREMVEGNLDLLEDVERGHGVYVVLYRTGRRTGCSSGGTPTTSA
jgi:hypothetical protein